MTQRAIEQQQSAEARWREAWLAGPRRTRWDAVPLQVGDIAPDLELPDATGAPRRLSDLWSGGPLHLIFLRHFGCSAYAAFGLLEGTVPQILHDFASKPGDAATGDEWLAGRGDSERALVDNPWQLPGEFVIAPGGRISLAHRAQFCEDFPARGVVLGGIAAAGGNT